MTSLQDSAIIKEYLSVLKFKVKAREAQSRFHSRLIREANDQIDDDTFEALSDDAQQYLENCIKAMNEEEELPMPPDLENVAQADDAEETDDTADDAVETDGEEEPAAALTATDGGAEEPEDEGDGSGNGKAKPKAKSKGKSKGKKASSAKKPARGRDKFGLLNDSNSSLAASMFEKSAKMKDVKSETGTTHYNLLAKLEKKGHKIEKEKGVITLIHKDDI